MTLPSLNNDRLEQMICTACCCKQEARCRSAWQSLKDTLHHKSRAFFYGIGATAVTASCLTAMWMVPMTAPQPKLSNSEITFSDYILQDMLEDLG